MSPFLSNWDNPSFWIFPVEPADILRKRKLICVITLPNSWPTESENNKIFAPLNFKILIDMHFYVAIDNWNTYPLKRKNKFACYTVVLTKIDKYFVYFILGFPGGSVIKNLPANAGDRFDPWVRNIPWRRKWQPTPLFLPGKSHGQESGGLWSIGLQRVVHDLATKQ